MKLPVQKKILREDLKDAPDWINNVIGPINNFMETIYQAMNKNIDETNTQSQIREVTVVVPSTYPTMEPIKFPNTLKVRATGCIILQCIDRSTFLPVATSNPAWVDNNGVITISAITGLIASKTYTIRFRVT